MENFISILYFYINKYIFINIIFGLKMAIPTSTNSNTELLKSIDSSTQETSESMKQLIEKLNKSKTTQKKPALIF